MPPFSPSIAETRQALERHGIVSASPLLFQALAMVRRAALRGAAILLIGAPGTGKELIARYAHACSERANQPIVVVDCTTIPDTLAESVLLGHARGSFTGAASAHLGLVEQADGGFLFLDEVGDLTAKSQSVLLPVLEKGEYRSIGSNAVRRVDLQVVAATNKDLRLEVEQGRFRQDLFNRLDIVTVPIPSLCERPEDIPLLARHFVANHPAIRRGTVRGIDDAACKLLEAHPWPGNVRELKNLVDRAAALSRGKSNVDLATFLSDVDDADRGASGVVIDKALAFKEAKGRVISDFESQYILTLLREHGNNISLAAREAGIDRKHFKDLMRKHGIEARPEED